LPVHPTQLYSSAAGFLLCLLLYFFWRYGQRPVEIQKPANKLIRLIKPGFPKRFLLRLGAPGSTFALMFVLYGIFRFFIEFVRDDNPFEFANITISQIISVPLVIFGVALIVIFTKAPPEKLLPKRSNEQVDARTFSF